MYDFFTPSILAASVTVIYFGVHFVFAIIDSRSYHFRFVYTNIMENENDNCTKFEEGLRRLDSR